MKTTQAKPKEKKFFGEASGIFLTHWLNGPREKPWVSWKAEFCRTFGPVTINGTAEADAKARVRIAYLVRALKQFVDMAGELYSDHGDSKDAREWHRFMGLHDLINNEFARYPACPQISINPPVKNAGGHFKPFYPRGRAYDWAMSHSLPGALFQEMIAIKFIQDAEKQGWLSQVGECRVCGRWFFARRHGTRHCSTKCGKKEYQSSERYKEWRHHHYLNHEKRRRIRKQMRLDSGRDK